MNLKSKRVTIVSIGVTFFIILLFFLNDEDAVQSNLEKPVSEPSRTEVMGTGTLEARVQVNVSPKISGRILNIFADQGEKILAGSSLVELDSEELVQQVAIAQAYVDASKAGVERLKSDKKRAEAILKNAELGSTRTRALADKNAVSKDDSDKSIESLEVAQSGLIRSEAAIVEGQKELLAAEKTLEYHQARLRNTRIDAPFDSLILRRTKEPGDIVVPGTTILTIISTAELWISAWIDETEISKLAENQPAKIIFRSEPNKIYKGRVSRLGKQVDRESREFLVEVGTLELPTNWAIGQRAEVYIETSVE